MFDEGSKSLWSTLQGEPVIGPLTGSGERLRSLPIVTTTWGEWRRQHPKTSVLSVHTGFERDYGEGKAYRDYFSTDRLWYDVPRHDDRLKSKDEVLVFRLSSSSEEEIPFAISVRFLKKKRLFQFRERGLEFVVVTSARGASRVYQTSGHSFGELKQRDRLADLHGYEWLVTEEGLVRSGSPSQTLPRIAAQRAFWFGWYAQYPNTRLIK
jgi:hypothetical protein